MPMREDAYTFLSQGRSLSAKLLSPITGISAEAPIVVVASGDSKKGFNTETWVTVGKALVEEGIPVFLFDYQGCGRSEGDYSDLSALVGSANLTDAVEFGRKMWGGARKLACIGSSFGGAVALTVQAQTNSFCALSLKSPAFFLPEGYENDHTLEQMDAWRREGVSPVSGIKFSSYIQSFSINGYVMGGQLDIPVQIIHGADDCIVPVSQSLRFARLAQSRLEMHILPNVGHSYKEDGALQTLAKYQVQFFKEVLGVGS